MAKIEETVNINNIESGGLVYKLENDFADVNVVKSESLEKYNLTYSPKGMGGGTFINTSEKITDPEKAIRIARRKAEDVFDRKIPDTNVFSKL